MIDLHSHILWGLDDGAQCLEDSIGMLKVAADTGTTAIVATPHANHQYRYNEAVVEERVRELASATGGLPEIHRGCEFHLSFDNIQDALAHPARYAIDGGSYILVEFPDTPLRGFGEALETMLGRGLIPIMTHPERHPDLQKIDADLLHWIHIGCLVQVTAQSLLGRFGKSAEESAWEMLNRSLAHFVASDAHGVAHRPPRLDEAFAAVARRCGEETAAAVFVLNPQAVLTGGKIRRGAPKRRPWYRLKK